MNFYIVNIETTGLDESVHELVGITAIHLDENAKAQRVDSFKGRCHFPERIQKEAFRQLGVSSVRDICALPPRKEFYDRFIQCLEQVTNGGENKLMLVGYVGQIEKNFIYSLFNEFTNNHGHDVFFKYFVSEYLPLIGLTYIYAMMKNIVFPSYKMNDVCDTLKIETNINPDRAELWKISRTKKLLEFFNKEF